MQRNSKGQFVKSTPQNFKPNFEEKNHKISVNAYIVSIIALLVSIISLYPTYKGTEVAVRALEKSDSSGIVQDSVNKSMLTKLEKLSELMNMQKQALNNSVAALQEMVEISESQKISIERVVRTSNQYVSLTDTIVKYQRKQVDELERKLNEKPNFDFYLGYNSFWTSRHMFRNKRSEVEAINFISENQFKDTLKVEATLPIMDPSQSNTKINPIVVNIILQVRNTGNSIATNPRLKVNVFDISSNYYKYKTICKEVGVSTDVNIETKPLENIMPQTNNPEPCLYHFRIEINDNHIYPKHPNQVAPFFFDIAMWADNVRRKTSRVVVRVYSFGPQ